MNRIAFFLKKINVPLSTIFFLLLIIPTLFWNNPLYKIGGDDSLLYYIFPLEMIRYFLINIISNNNLSVLGVYGNQLYMFPFYFLILLFKNTLPFLNIQALFYGFNLGLGFLFFFYLLGLWIKSKNLNHNFLIKVIASVHYVFSCFTVYTLWQSQLFVMYLVAIFPLILYLFIKGVQENKKIYIILNSVILSIFSILLLSVPWFVALLISSFPLLFFFFLKNKKRFVIFSSIFILILILLNFYWLFHFVYSPFSSDHVAIDIISGVTSQSFRNSNQYLVRIVSAGNSLIFPFLALFHKNIQQQFGWQTYNIFSQQYLILLYLNLVFLIPIILASFFLRKTKTQDRQLYLYSLVSWLITLYFFTVKIGNWGVNLFVWLTLHIPGFVMFRNMYDKFGLALAFSYAFLFAISLKIVFDNISNARIKNFSLLVIFVIILLNAKPFILGEFYKYPMWTTKNTYNTISGFNSDFNDLIFYLKKMDEPSRFLWLPMNNANYIQISDKSLKNHYYSGVSPLQFLANKSDFNGKISFPARESDEIFKGIKEGKYNLVGNYFRQFNVKYIIINRDISQDLQQSYLFGHALYDSQNMNFYNVVLGKLVRNFGKRYSIYEINSRFANEKIYITEDTHKFPTSFLQIKYRKKASYEYIIQVKNLTNKSYLVFLDPYHKQWELRLPNSQIFINGSHKLVFDYANGWLLDPEYIRKNVSKQYYHENVDGSIDMTIKLFFKPQNYFIPGIIVSISILLLCIINFFYRMILNLYLKRLY